MKTEQASTKLAKVYTEEQHDTQRSARKTFRDLQHTAHDKENIVGRTPAKDVLKMTSDPEIKRKKTVNKGVQTEAPTEITVEDLMSDKPSELYWKTLAEKRREALDESCHENEKLKDLVANLKEENRLCNEMLDESRTLVEVLQEMLEEVSGDAEVAQEATEED